MRRVWGGHLPFQHVTGKIIDGRGLRDIVWSQNGSFSLLSTWPNQINNQELRGIISTPSFVQIISCLGTRLKITLHYIYIYYIILTERGRGSSIGLGHRLESCTGVGQGELG
ncbi:hypothetical protein KFK09_019056 [Dendrobium nobile]|uniref:Uncharacterized protein n=1 Tax=Dendrobium nobile TaxID=94219 RepID=A0A8T3AX00_DENNO|nr:hypothetical protein KFK09_019056 [Dendrobium nobile]